MTEPRVPVHYKGGHGYYTRVPSVVPTLKYPSLNPRGQLNLWMTTPIGFLDLNVEEQRVFIDVGLRLVERVLLIM